MTHSGQTAIDYLINEINKEDLGESSHWRKYHSDFKFTGEGFSGLQGFGGNKNPYKNFHLALHNFLQKRFRRMGKEFPDFKIIENLAKNIANKQNRAYDQDLLRQTLTVAFFKKYFDEYPLSSGSTMCVIGDGFASMTSLLLASGLASRVVLVNLTKTLLVDLWYLNLWMGKEMFNKTVDLVTDETSLERALSKPVTKEKGGQRVIAIQATHHDLLQKCPIDLAINIASMQEMDPPIIDAYFDDLRTIAEQKRIIFYCCNREEKLLPDGTVTRFSDYKWQEDDKIIVDELCPWHQQYYSFRPPFYRPYDGPIRHRLVRF